MFTVLPLFPADTVNFHFSFLWPIQSPPLKSLMFRFPFVSYGSVFTASLLLCLYAIKCSVVSTSVVWPLTVKLVVFWPIWVIKPLWLTNDGLLDSSVLGPPPPGEMCCPQDSVAYFPSSVGSVKLLSEKPAQFRYGEQESVEIIFHVKWILILTTFRNTAAVRPSSAAI